MMNATNIFCVIYGWQNSSQSADYELYDEESGLEEIEELGDILGFELEWQKAEKYDHRSARTRDLAIWGPEPFAIWILRKLGLSKGKKYPGARYKGVDI